MHPYAQNSVISGPFFNKKTDLLSRIVEKLTPEINLVNPYARLYKDANAKFKECPEENWRVILKHQIEEPNGVGMVQRDDDESNVQRRDIVLEDATGALFKMDEIHSAYDPLAYPLIFPNGDSGWHWSERDKPTKKKGRQCSSFTAIDFLSASASAMTVFAGPKSGCNIWPPVFMKIQNFSLANPTD